MLQVVFGAQQKERVARIFRRYLTSRRQLPVAILNGGGRRARGMHLRRGEAEDVMHDPESLDDDRPSGERVSGYLDGIDEARSYCDVLAPETFKVQIDLGAVDADIRNRSARCNDVLAGQKRSRHAHSLYRCINAAPGG